MNSLNYLEIVLEGYFKRENRQYLDNYFYRAFKQCEKQHFEMDEFFDGCFGVIDSLNNEIQRQVSEHLIDANKAILHAEKKGDEKQAESIAKRIKDIRPNGVGNISFTINMLHFTNGKIAHHMTYDEVQSIKLHILKAYKKAKTEKLKTSLSTLIKEESVQMNKRQQKLKILTNNTKLAGLKSDNIEEYYKEQYHKWLFHNSDTTFIDGELHSQAKDTPTTTEGQNIFLDVSFFSTVRPQPQKVEVCGTKQGHELSEQKFITYEIKRVEKIDDNLLSDVNQWNKENYLKFLDEKNIKPSDHPFNDDTFKIFEHLVEKWKYDKQQKWADIFIELDATDYKMPYKNDYEAYVRKTYGYTGKFQYDKQKKETNRNRIALLELINNFSKK